MVKTTGAAIASSLALAVTGIAVSLIFPVTIPITIGLVTVAGATAITGTVALAVTGNRIADLLSSKNSDKQPRQLQTERATTSRPKLQAQPDTRTTSNLETKIPRPQDPAEINNPVDTSHKSKDVFKLFNEGRPTVAISCGDIFESKRSSQRSR